MLTVNERIKAIRERRGLTQKELALMADVSPSEICAIEKRMRSPQTDTIRKIGAALEVSVSLLLGEFYSEFPLEKALAHDSFDIFVRGGGLTDDLELALRKIRNTSSAPQSVRGWQQLNQNLAIYEGTKRPPI